MVKKYLIFSIYLVFYVGQINAASNDYILSIIQKAVATQIHDLEKNYNESYEVTDFIITELLQIKTDIDNEIKKYRQDRLDYYAELVANHDNCSNSYKDLEGNSFSEIIHIAFETHEMLSQTNEFMWTNLNKANELKKDLEDINNLIIYSFQKGQEDNTNEVNQNKHILFIMKQLTDIKIRKDLYIVELRKLPNKMKLMINNFKNQSYVKKYNEIMSNLEKEIKDCITLEN